MKTIIQSLLESDELSIRYRISIQVLDCDPQSPEMRALQQTIADSPRVHALLSERDAEGKIPLGAYSKWQGAHWVLNMLADLAYPPGDESLQPLAQQVYDWLFADNHVNRARRLTFNGRTRMCASMEGNAIYYLLALGLADDRVDALAQRLLDWQWPDGGWNCDKHPEAIHTSSFMESLIPLRGLALYAQRTGSTRAKVAAEHSTEIFLKRHLYKRQRDSQIMNPQFAVLHYPCYWHYDILFGLKVLAEAGFIQDVRCAAALDLLESKRLPDGGFPAEKTYYRVTDKQISGRSVVDWGGTSRKRMNPFVTADALSVLKAAGRFNKQLAQ
jgi:hypothetical protein